MSPYRWVVVNLLLGSLVGAWAGASWATRLRTITLYRVLSGLLLLIAAVLTWHHFGRLEPLELGDIARSLLGIAAGVEIGMVAALMGVAGSELLIPTIVLLYGVDIKIAGSLSLVVSLPTMVVAFARYSRNDSFGVLNRHAGFVAMMAAGSIIGVLIGGLLLGVVDAMFWSRFSWHCLCSRR